MKVAGRRFNVGIKAFLVAVVLCLLVGTVTAGTELTITPRSVAVEPGDNATYTVEVRSITTETEQVSLSMEDSIPGWGYTFSDPEFDLAPGEIKIVTLTVLVPATASGKYEAKIKAEAVLPDLPPEISEKSYFTILTTTNPSQAAQQVPGLSPPGLAILIGLLLVIAVRRINGKNRAVPEIRRNFGYEKEKP
jgi:hypothetical protein